EGTNPPIILSRQDFTNRFATNRIGMPPPRPPPEPPHEPPPEPRSAENPTNLVSAGGAMPAPPEIGANREPPREGNFRPRFGRPRWMSEEQYQSLLQKQGVHSFVIVMSTQPVHAICDQDFWLRSIIAVLATISVLGSGLAWRTLSKTSDLQIRLVRASEMNSHLREMNLAAAGLAHETRSPPLENRAHRRRERGGAHADPRHRGKETARHDRRRTDRHRGRRPTVAP